MPRPGSAADRAESLIRAGQYAQAETSMRRHLRQSPNDVEALHALAITLIRQNKAEQAEFFARKAASLPGVTPPTFLALGMCLVALGRPAEAVGWFRRAHQESPRGGQDEARMLEWLGRALWESGDLAEVIPTCERAAQLDQSRLHARWIIGEVLTLAGRPREGLEVYRQLRDHTRRVTPDDPQFQSTLAFQWNYLPDAHAQELLAEHQLAGERMAAVAPRDFPVRAVADDPERRLRIAYISPDLRGHPVGTFVEPLLTHHDRRHFEVFCYYTCPVKDEAMRRLQGFADHWKHLGPVAPGVTARAVTDDRIDVVVELSGHTGGTSLTALAARLAPVQVTYLGYPNTTGVPNIDARIVDAHTDPPGEVGALATERLIRLPRCFVCYAPPAEAPPPACAPRRETDTGAIRFASFNFPGKVGPWVVEAWARILKQTPGSTLLLKGKSMDNPWLAEQFRARFVGLGVEPSRIRTAAKTATMQDHLAMYLDVDIALDTFPYNGTTTTCDALWMGVPVVAFTGSSHRSRVSASLLSAIGAPELVAANEEGYVRLACELARDAQRLRGYHATLREKMAKSELCDGPGLARAMEAAIGRLWVGACGG